MITSSSNSRVKQVVQWQKSAKEREEAGIFLAEGFKMFEEVPEASVREVYFSEAAYAKLAQYPKLREKAECRGYELVSEEEFAKMSDTSSYPLH